jgi:membrane protease YdiL (CAAX protease family)
MAEDTPEPPEPAGPIRRLVIVRLAIVVEGGLLVLAGFLGWLVDQPPLTHLAWTWTAVWQGVVAALPLLGLFAVFLRWPFGPMRRILHFSERVLCPVLASCTVIDMLGISVLAGLGEEVFFRGFLQAYSSHWLGITAENMLGGRLPTEVCRRIGLAAGIVVASLFFGALHAITLTYALMAAVMGAYLGCVWLWTGNLLSVVVAHALYDFVVLLWLLRGPGSAERRAAPLEEPEEEAESQ